MADRGFGYTRFMNACTDAGFDYVVRTQSSWKIEKNKFQLSKNQACEE